MIYDKKTQRRLDNGLFWLTIEPPPPPTFREKFIGALWVVAVVLGILAGAGWMLAKLHYDLADKAEKITVAIMNGDSLYNREDDEAVFSDKAKLKKLGVKNDVPRSR